MGAGVLPALSRTAQWAAVALGCSIPISVALDNTLLAVVALCWLAAGAWREKWRAALANPVAIAALLLFALLVLGTLYGSRHPGDGASYLLKYLDLLFLPVFAFLMRGAAQRRRALHAFAASLGVVLVISCLIGAGMPAARPLLGGPGYAVAFKHYLTHSILMAYAAFLYTQIALAEPNRTRRMLWAVAAALAAFNVLFLTQGRTGHVLLGILALYTAYGWLRWRGLAIGAAVTAAAVVALMMVPGPFKERFNPDATGGPPTLAREWAQESNAERQHLYRTAISIIREHPLMGVGTGGYPRAYAELAGDSDFPYSRNPHSEYLLIAVQLGLPGLAALLALFWLHWRLAPRLASPLECHLARGLVLAIAAGCVVNALLLDHTEGLLYAWLTGVLFGGLKSPDSKSGDG